MRSPSRVYSCVAAGAVSANVVTDRPVGRGQLWPDRVPHPGVAHALVQEQEHRLGVTGFRPAGILRPDFVGTYRHHGLHGIDGSAAG